MKAECQSHLDAHGVPVDLPIAYAAQILKIHPGDSDFMELCPACAQLMTAWLQQAAMEAGRRSQILTVPPQIVVPGR